MIIESKFSGSPNCKVDELNSPFLASDVQANTLRPATRPTVTADSPMNVIATPQRSSFEKERKTVTLNKINL